MKYNLLKTRPSTFGKPGGKTVPKRRNRAQKSLLPHRLAGRWKGFALRIRRASIADLDALLTIERQSFRCDRIGACALRRWILGERSRVLIAAAQGTIFGYVAVQFRGAVGDIARVSSIAVRRGARGLGIGMALMRRAECAARRAGRDRMRLEVRVGNRRALSLYRALSYRKLRDLPSYYADGGDAMRMEKNLRARRQS